MKVMFIVTDSGGLFADQVRRRADKHLLPYCSGAYCEYKFWRWGQLDAYLQNEQVELLPDFRADREEVGPASRLLIGGYCTASISATVVIP